MEQTAAARAHRAGGGDVTSIEYRHRTRFRQDFDALATARCQRPGAQVCDIGGGAHPLLDPGTVTANAIDYTVLDVAPDQVRELDASAYRVIIGDVADPSLARSLPDATSSFDVLFSRMVAEHVAGGEDFHRNIFELAAPGATALHLFPTLYALPFVANKLLPESLSTRALGRFASRSKSKFPATYSWCLGPSPRQVQRLYGFGWEIARYIGVLGHGYYEGLPLVRAIHDRLTQAALRRPRHWMTSFAMLELRKPT